MSSVESSSFPGGNDDTQYTNVETLQSQLLDLEERMRPVVKLSESFGSGTRRDELKRVADSVKEALDTAKKLNERLVSNASAIREELEILLLKEEESDSSLRLKRLLRAAGSAEDVDGLKSQVEEVSSQLIEAQSHKLFLETKLQEKDKIIKTLQDNLANTLADMKHIRGETQKSMSKHEKRTREAESRVKSMASELKRANEMATRYKAQFENDRRRKSTTALVPAATSDSATATHLTLTKNQQSLLPREAKSAMSPPEIAGEAAGNLPSTHAGGRRSRNRISSVTSNTAKEPKQELKPQNEKDGDEESYLGKGEVPAGRDSPDICKSGGGLGQNKSKRGVSNSVSPRPGYGTGGGVINASPTGQPPVHMVEVSGTARTCLNVEDIIRKNHQFLEDATDRDNEVKMWRSLFIDMSDKIKAYYNEMLRCQGEVATLYEERMDLKSRLHKEQKDNAIMRKELDQHASAFVEYKKLQSQLSEEIKWSKLTPLAPTKIYSKSRPKTFSRSRPIPVQSWSG